jgi:hypothetical protein
MIANWNSGTPADCLQSLAERGHPQEIAGYYDSDNRDNLRKRKVEVRLHARHD